ncbi:hypothetical protein [Flexibacterium corallicola]|uniref:hypothetical protein n=1 Tax=Flexibacterium corallicola TaxID=3037259 RepID=UPI00286FAA09|nr:hypothetical protein [Pseudovibrio sp. M1P-2-3]
MLSPARKTPATGSEREGPVLTFTSVLAVAAVSANEREACENPNKAHVQMSLASLNIFVSFVASCLGQAYKQPVKGASLRLNVLLASLIKFKSQIPGRMEGELLHPHALEGFE